MKIVKFTGGFREKSTEVQSGKQGSRRAEMINREKVLKINKMPRERSRGTEDRRFSSAGWYIRCISLEI
jgi:hypothetical protein